MDIQPKNKGPFSSGIFPIADSPVLNPRLLSIGDAAKYLGGTSWAVRRLIWQGALPYVQVGKRFVIAREELDAWITRSTRREGVGIQPHIGANHGAIETKAKASPRIT